MTAIDLGLARRREQPFADVRAVALVTSIAVIRGKREEPRRPIHTVRTS
jgi:hypothetical protein